MISRVTSKNSPHTAVFLLEPPRELTPRFAIIYIMRNSTRAPAAATVTAVTFVVGSANVDALSAKSRRIGLKPRRTGSNVQANDDAEP
jgi:hypothetical protein